MSYAMGRVDGERAFVERVQPFEARDIERAKSVHMLLLAESGVPQARIAEYFGVSRCTVWRRINAIPPQAREFYRSRKHLIGVAP